jgi:hypothetical protein
MNIEKFKSRISETMNNPNVPDEKYFAEREISICRNHTGHRCGASHPKARLTDAQVREMRHKRETENLTYATLAEMFSCGESTVRDIVKYWVRAGA